METAKQKAIREAYKDVLGYEGLYKISKEGEVMSCAKKWVRGYSKEKTLKTRKNIHGYNQCILQKNKVKKTFTVHRLVALTFIPNPDNKPQVNHINGIKTDNRVDNLEWCTKSENLCHAYKIGIKSQNGSKNPNNVKIENKNNGKIYLCAQECADDLEISVGYVYSIINGNCPNTNNIHKLNKN